MKFRTMAYMGTNITCQLVFKKFCIVWCIVSLLINIKLIQTKTRLRLENFRVWFPVLNNMKVTTVLMVVLHLVVQEKECFLLIQWGPSTRTYRYCFMKSVGMIVHAILREMVMIYLRKNRLSNNVTK
uniref:Uncharacterized protein n=1 Tax=Cacopsylla melanoneura TaxID=428564 RepID=A0A8D8VMR3_9HEMI